MMHEIYVNQFIVLNKGGKVLFFPRNSSLLSLYIHIAQATDGKKATMSLFYFCYLVLKFFYLFFFLLLILLISILCQLSQFNLLV